MYIKRNYGFWMTFNWSKWPFIIGLIYSLVVFGICWFFQLEVSLPWQPIGVVGIAVAFYLGFKNNSSYDRTWEARKIWGSIVNNSRSFGASVCAYVQGAEAPEIQKELIYRHVAWLTALRYQLRLRKEWEHEEDRVVGMFVPTVCEAYFDQLDKELINYIPESEIVECQAKSNMATHILEKQFSRLQELHDQNYFEDFRHMKLHDLLTRFYDDQGKSERIKTFPFPRQYASTALWVTTIFCVILPIGMLDMFQGTIGWAYWLAPLVSALIIWIFFLMEKIGDYSENPFEGSYNDVPITAIAKTIEIDLREMINDTNIPEPVLPVNGFLL
jgi:putative membrane protein